MRAALALASLICMFSVPVKAAEAAEILLPIDLFVQACLGDEAKLPKAQFERISYGKIPKSAKLVVAYANPDATKFHPSPKVYAPKAISNGFVQAQGKEKVILILPDKSGGVPPMSAACGVIWPGRHFQEAAAEAYKLASLGPLPNLPSSGKQVPYSVTTFDDHVLVAAEHANWTILYISPDTTTSKDETQQ